MLKLGVLNLTLKSPEPNSSATEPTFLEAEADAWTGRGARGAGTGAGRLAWNLDPELKFDPDTAEDTVWDTSGDNCASTWVIMSSESAPSVTAVGAAGRTERGRAVVTEGRLEPEMVENTVWEIKGWTWDTTEEIISSEKEEDWLEEPLIEDKAEPEEKVEDPLFEEEAELKDKPLLAPLEGEPLLAPLKEPLLAPLKDEPLLAPLKEPLLAPLEDEPLLAPLKNEPLLAPLKDEPPLAPLNDEPLLAPLKDEPLPGPLKEEELEEDCLAGLCWIWTNPSLTSLVSVYPWGPAV